MDEAEIDQHLSGPIHERHRRGKHPLHERIPVRNAAGGVIALVGVGRTGKEQRRTLARYQRGDHGRVGRVAADQTVRTQLPDVTRLADRSHRRIRDILILGFAIRRILIIGTLGLFNIAKQVGQFLIAEAGQRQIEARC